MELAHRVPDFKPESTGSYETQQICVHVFLNIVVDTYILVNIKLMRENTVIKKYP